MGNLFDASEITFTKVPIWINGPSPSGKAAGFGPAIPRFES